ncbi:MAG TPA: NUDIX domain-containing protein [Candidatus Dormibacteraeota bacterium]|nr:NUDIX domain-containing protein [Candidatus Dormibacteraeota bacterium]
MSPPTVTVGGAVLPITGAQLALVRDGRVLIQLRPWPPGWEIPGGHCDDGEDPAEAAAREAEEETGLQVRVLRLAGVYTWAGLRSSSDAVYVGEVTGGRWRRSIEAVGHRWAGAADLPPTTFPWIHQRVADALAAAAGAPPVHRIQPVSLRHVLFFGARWAGMLVDAVRRRH